MGGLTLLLSAGELLPRGVIPYLLGGLLIGLGTTVIYLATGIIAGASTFLESTLASALASERAVPPATGSVASAHCRTPRS